MAKKRGPQRRPGPGPGQQQDPRARLVELTRQQRQLEVEGQRLVDALRGAGATWQEIADLTGLKSRQAARYRYTRGGSTTGE